MLKIDHLLDHGVGGGFNAPDGGTFSRSDRLTFSQGRRRISGVRSSEFVRILLSEGAGCCSRRMRDIIMRTALVPTYL